MAEEDRNERYLLPLFDGTEFPQWKYRLFVMLEDHDLLRCVEVEAADDPDLQEAEGDTPDQNAAKKALLEKRLKKDRRCKMLMVSRIHNSQLEYVQDLRTPKQILDALVRVFERKSIASRMSVQRKMMAHRYVSGPLKDFFLEYDRLVRQFRATGAEIAEIDVICNLLLNMGSAYATVVTTLESMKQEDLTLEVVKCRLLDEEVKRSTSDIELVTPKTESAAFAGDKKPRPKKKMKCFGCQQEGHKIADCPKKKQEQQPQKQGAGRTSKANSAESSSGEICFAAASKSGGTPPEKQKVQWIVDSGCSDHLVNDEELFEELVPLARPVEIAVAKEGESIVAHHSGTVRLQTIVDGERRPCSVSNVLYVPALRMNLFSVLQVEKKGMKVVFERGKVRIFSNSELVATGARRGQCYELDLFRLGSAQSESLLACGRISKNLQLWHRRFGHLNMNQLNQLIAKGFVDGLKPEHGDVDNSVVVCEPCVVGKQTRKPFSAREGKRSSRVLEIVHSDVCGPISPEGANGERYFVTFIDDWSHFLMVFPMVTKDEVLDRFTKYEAYATAKFGVKISRLRCDNGGEYKNKAFVDFCERKGIRMECTVPYTPEQNATSERMNRTVVERGRAMLEDAAIDKRFWVQAIQTAAYLVNRSPTNANEGNVTPFEVWEGRHPDVSNLRVFGATVYVHVPKERRKKLDAKAWKGIFVGYSNNGYKVWNPETKQESIARDVDFVEDPEPAEAAEVQKREECEVPVICKKDCDGESVVVRDEEVADEEEDEAFDTCSEPDVEAPESDPEAAPVQEDDTPATQGRPNRNRNPPAWHNDYEVEYGSSALSALSYVDDLPDTLDELRKRPDWEKWQGAMQEEMDSLLKNNTWTLAKLPEGRSAVTCKWIFKIKPSDDDHPARYKARLVARGFSQKRGFDYNETYSPVARLDTLRVVLALANRERMIVHQMDVKTAFLNGELSEEIYMQQPEGFPHKDGMVCRLNRSLYGLKQASGSWNERFHKFVERLGFERSANDQCLYLRGKDKQQVILVLYVDDVLVISPSENLVKTVKLCLSNEFEMTDQGEVRNFLGMKIDRDEKKRVMRISQRRYLESLLSRFQMEDCRPIATPMENKLKLLKGEEAERTTLPYRELVGCVMYVSLTTRPDLAVAANYFSQFQACPTDAHFVQLRRVLRYIQGTLDYGLIYRGDDEGPLLEAYSDADWANDIVDRRSVSGAVFKVFGATVCWMAKKQATVSLSSTEAELVALCAAACHGEWLRRILGELGRNVGEAVPFHEDNQSTIKIVTNPKDSGRLKHMDVKHFFVRELVEQGKIKVDYIPSNLQLADILTKSLPAPTFRKLRTSVGVLDCRV